MYGGLRPRQVDHGFVDREILYLGNVGLDKDWIRLHIITVVQGYAVGVLALLLEDVVVRKRYITGFSCIKSPFVHGLDFPALRLPANRESAARDAPSINNRYRKRDLVPGRNGYWRHERWVYY